MHFQKNPKRIALKISIFLVVLLLLAGAGLAVFQLLGGKDLLPLKGTAPTPLSTQDSVQAMTFDPFAFAESTVTETSLREFYKSAVSEAAQNGFNTLIATGKQGLHVLWRDNIFPAPGEVSALDGFLGSATLDPLAILCEESAAQNLQLWLEIDPYSAAGRTAQTKGRAAYHAEKQGVTGWFSAGDAVYAKLLARSLSRLPHTYPVAGIVFTGLDTVNGQPIKNPDAWRDALGTLLKDITAAWKENDNQTSISLRFSTDATALITPVFAAAQASAGTIKNLLPAIPTGGGLAQRLALWGAQGAGLIVTPPPADNSAVSLFTAAGTPGFAGSVLASYPLGTAQQEHLTVLRSTLVPAPGSLPTGFSIPQTLSVNYPAAGQKIFTEGLFIMGTSNPAQPLLLNGAEVSVRGENGAFGVAVTLALGENTFTFAQGETTVALNVLRPEPPADATGAATPFPEDGTREAAPGQAVQVATQIASALTEYGDDSKINETFPKGALAVVQQSVQTTRWDAARGTNVRTWAYKLSSGDYLLARNCAWLAGEGKSVFTAPTLRPDEASRGEWLTLFENATPAAYVAYEEGTLKLTFHDTTSVAANDATWGSLVTNATVEQAENSITLSLQMAEDFWGYLLDYSQGKTQLFLKRAPHLSNDPLKPLAGVEVLLDPGHGDTDIGAPGLMGSDGPNEKDVNLVLAQTTAYRLRQLGATVNMTREGDSFPALEDRLGAQSAQKPDFFISLHHNSAELTQDLNGVSGAQVYYYHPYNLPPSKTFAQNLIDEIAPATGRAGGEARWGYYYVTRTTACPSVLFEYGFIINPLEFEDISSTDGIYAAACATAEGLLRSVPGAPASDSP